MRTIPSCLILLLLLTSCHQFRPTESTLEGAPYRIQLVDSANACLERSDYVNSLKLGKQVTELSKAANDNENLWEGLSVMMATYCQLGMNDSAIVISKQLLDYDKKMGDPYTLSSDYNNLAFLYLAAGYDSNMAEEFILKAIE